MRRREAILQWRTRRGRRGAVIVQVAVMSTIIMGMGALALDIGAMYTARTELQAAVDAAALAAASQLGGNQGGAGTPEELAREAARKYSKLNGVFGTYAEIDTARDLEFGRSVYNSSTKRFSFEPGGSNYDAVRITVRRTDDSTGGALAMTFANMFGLRTKGLWARAAAVLVPRDIAVVIDLSGSMNDDSEFQHYKQFQSEITGNWIPGQQINLRDIWCALNGPAPAKPYEPGSETETEYAGDSGPSIGNMSTWGSHVVPQSYNPSSDSGLWYIPKSANCTVSAIQTNLQSRSYTADEISILMSGSRDSAYSNQWLDRTAVMLNLATWKSGRTGGRSGGDGDAYVETSEITWGPYPSYRGSTGWTWTDYINYVASTSTTMYTVNSAFRYRFGLKTFTNFLLENESGYAQTNNLWQTPEQPLRAVKDAVQTMMNVIDDLDSLDHVSLEVFAQTGVHELNLTDDVQTISTRLYQRQSAHYNSTTNIGAGLKKAITELKSSRVRGGATKVIVLMSDGKPNCDSTDTYVGFVPSATNYALDQARSAADNGFVIYTVSVGYDADRQLMQQIAALGRGQEFYAAGTPGEYAEQLQAIFRTLGGKRPVTLIQ